MLDNAYFLSTYFQKSNIDLTSGSILIKSFEKELESMRANYESEFEQFEEKAKELAQKCVDVDTEYDQKRSRKVTIRYGETAEDDVNTDPRRKFMIESYLVSLDAAKNRTNERFQHFHQVASKFYALDPRKFNDPDNENKLAVLASTYSTEIESVNKVVDEFNSFKSICKDIVTPDIKKNASFKEICKYIMCTTKKDEDDNKLNMNNMLKFMIANDWCSVYPNLTILYRIYMTLPIASAAAERSFSRLSLIKDYLRSTMSEDRLSSLALISIEKTFAYEVNYNDVID